MQTTVAVVFGGKSVEHEVSIISAIQAIENMDRSLYNIIPVYMTKDNEFYIGDDVGKIESYKDIPKLLEKSQHVVFAGEKGGVFLMEYPPKLFHKQITPVDVVFPVVHGTNVEDGTLQGYFKTLGVPFVGCDVEASAVGMDKFVQKLILHENNIPVLEGELFNLGDYGDIEEMYRVVESNIGYPVIVKPVNLGSSVGIGIAKDRAELGRRIDDAFLYAKRILIEHAITNLREINCAVLGDELEAIPSECEEPLHTGDILDYADKYGNRSKTGSSEGMASVSRILPAKLEPEQRDKIRNLAVRAFGALGCNGVARMDFMIDEDNGNIYFNEINTIPGSLAFYLWEPVGISYSELINRLIDLAMRRKRSEDRLTFSFETNILDTQSLFGSKGSKQ